ncbi:hypothetical protein [Ruania rhizosphaerae]|uniref:hypothetical protein n=1 Tax=Ruania rhizosphaerae TaxID=1840413 RepID=UPI00135BEEBC|nr:hypothetical protein [Ruania rhizosphaerae]
MSIGSTPQDPGEESWLGLLLGQRVSGALLRLGYGTHHLVDVLTAAGPGGLSAGVARDGTAHGVPFDRI